MFNADLVADDGHKNAGVINAGSRRNGALHLPRGAACGTATMRGI